MVRAKWLLASALLVGLGAFGSGCENGGKAGGGMKSGMAPPFGGPDDVSRATSLWRGTLQNYKSWPAYPGKSGWQPGKSPHGKVLRYYINATAASNPAHPGYGSIIVKENYMKENGPLMAVTVMQKIRGYDKDDADWFWVKYSAKGDVMTNPKGMKLAGRVAKGMPQGCIACHSNAGGGDFLFVND